MSKFKKAFLDLLQKLRKENKAVINILSPEKYNESTTIGQAYVWEKPPKITLKKDKRTTYRDLLLALVHEYGHILDYLRYGDCKKWRISFDFSYGDDEIYKAKQYPIHVKHSLLLIEFHAEKNARKILKKYGIVLFSDAELEEELTLQIKIRKHEFLYGKMPTDKLMRQWRTNLRKKPEIMDLKTIRNLKKI